jgi:hypothetical protein
MHGILDYLVGALLIASPWLFGFADGGIETWLPVALGASALVYSLCTNYEMGAARLLSMKTHLTLDFLSGALLAVSPWLFGFSDHVYMPHLVLGIFEMMAALITRTTPDTAKGTQHTRSSDRPFAH